MGLRSDTPRFANPKFSAVLVFIFLYRFCPRCFGRNFFLHTAGERRQSGKVQFDTPGVQGAEFPESIPVYVRQQNSLVRKLYCPYHVYQARRHQAFSMLTQKSDSLGVFANNHFYHKKRATECPHSLCTTRDGENELLVARKLAGETTTKVAPALRFKRSNCDSSHV